MVPAVTELSMLAVKRTQFLAVGPDEELRVYSKFRMCFDPHRSSRKKTKSSNVCINSACVFSEEVLQKEAELNAEAFDAINAFINCLQKPVYLIAHNGLSTHFPILTSYLFITKRDISREVFCADSLHAFFDLDEEEKRQVDRTLNRDTEDTEVQSYQDLFRTRFWKSTLVRSWMANKKLPKAVREHYASEESYKLKYLYAREWPGADQEGNTAENDCTMMLKVAQKRAEKFSRWVDQNHCYFYDVPRYEPLHIKE
ncbi:hypothetical protein PYW07_006958 [Mythimna separata]|uniref:Uncharacterized protein n=1 Tax=Mythimna separata TaxID=271217 RepID=A0AAD7Z0V5_MYTSE|nr:hypothetical protein PYW07_006958 [Mythimna separata]